MRINGTFSSSFAWYSFKKEQLKDSQNGKKISLPNDVRVKGMLQDYQHRKKKKFP